MKKIFVTGVSGTGKTTISNILNTKDIYSVSLDEFPGLCCWRDIITGKKIDGDVILDKFFIDTHDWVCDVDVLNELLNKNSETIVVFGIASNQNQFLDLFDKIVLLQCKPETFINRIKERKDNDFGKDKSAQDFLLGSYKAFEDDLLQKGAIPISTEGSIEAVVGNIISEILK